MGKLHEIHVVKYPCLLCTLPLGKRGDVLIVLLGHKLPWFMRWMCIYVLDMLICYELVVSTADFPIDWRIIQGICCD